jgi:hypothetical protein
MRILPNSNDLGEIPVDLGHILAHKVPDFILRADDILFIPTKYQ